jgi:TPR repeat protein
LKKFIILITLLIIGISTTASEKSDEKYTGTKLKENYDKEVIQDLTSKNLEEDKPNLPTTLLPFFKNKKVSNKFRTANKAGQWQIYYDLSTYLLTKSAFNLRKSLALLKFCAKKGTFDAKRRYQKLKYLDNKKFLNLKSSDEVINLLKDDTSPYALMAELQLKLTINSFTRKGSSLAYSLSSLEDKAISLIKLIPKDYHAYEILGLIHYQNNKAHKSLEIYKIASSLGSSEGFNEIALAHKKGGLLVENKEKMIHNFNKCAELGNPRCLNSIGFRHSNGFFGKKDKEKAIYYYLKAAKSGWATSYKNLSLIYNEESHINYDLHQEYALHAVLLGESTAYGILSRIYRKGLGVKVNNEIAFYWAISARKTSNAYSLFELAYCYDKGIGVVRDDHKAFKFYERATLNNSYAAASNLASFYQYGRGIQKDCKIALKLHTIAANKGKLYSASKLYQIYRGKCDKGQLDEEKKMYWAELAAKQYYRKMPYSYAWELAYGSKKYRNYPLAKTWYLRSVENGLIDAAYGLASIYYKGLGIEKDFVSAYAWYKLASNYKKNEAKSLKYAKKSYTKLNPEQRKEALKLEKSYIEKYID